MTKGQFAKSLDASEHVCEGLTAIGSGRTFKKLTSRQLFESLYLVRSLEHFQSVVLLLGREQYNSALALRRVLYETYLRGMWISRCATDQIIAAARKDNFELSEKEFNRKKLEKELEEAKVSGLQVESKWYGRGCGFVHGGLHETAMYAIRANPRVSQHLFRTLYRELRLSTLRLLQVFLEFHSSMMRAAVAGKPYGSFGSDELMMRTDQIKILAEEYKSALKGLKADTSVRA